MLQRFFRKKVPAVNTPLNEFPAVSIIVPAYNEEINAMKTINNLSFRIIHISISFLLMMAPRIILIEMYL